MDELLYRMIYKRKSFHVFKDIQKITTEELQKIETFTETLIPLVPDIKTTFRIVPANETSCKRGQEYCILLYSEKKGNYLQNIGYLGEQIDLYLASINIGALWFGIGKVEEEQYNGLDFVIMIAIAKVTEDKFRKDMFKSKRKKPDEIWQGMYSENIGNIVRFAPSACNTQPWQVDVKDNQLTIYRYKKPGKRGIMPAVKGAYYNRIDIGIFLYFLELCLKHEKIKFERTLYEDMSGDDVEKTLTAVYTINKD